MQGMLKCVLVWSVHSVSHETNLFQSDITTEIILCLLHQPDYMYYHSQLTWETQCQLNIWQLKLEVYLQRDNGGKFILLLVKSTKERLPLNN